MPPVFEKKLELLTAVAAPFDSSAAPSTFPPPAAVPVESKDAGAAAPLAAAAPPRGPVFTRAGPRAVSAIRELLLRTGILHHCGLRNGFRGHAESHG